MSEGHKVNGRKVLVFKMEGEVAGEAAPGAGVPFTSNCVCAVAAGSPGGRCATCGGAIAGAVGSTVAAARAKAAELGLELLET